ncbi:unnamed protein product [Moneuplotes crassus]|uniref:Palmitoyltransferase n=1 Tax=Euplotes crassus TaxID=5936 RepID=A0AAD2CZF9_EUPCR|nr:unnamed protein product [Moneuplotes crassus]
MPQRIGRMKALSASPNGAILRVLGPDWWMTLLASLIIIVGFILTVIVILSYDSFIIKTCCILFATLFFFAIIWSLLSLATTDPGIIPRSDKRVTIKTEFYMTLKDVETFDKDADGIDLKICRTCMIVRPPRSFHCSKCNTCIEMHDHHCPWVGQCVGLRNNKKFFVFLLTTGIGSLCGSMLCLPPLIERSDAIFLGDTSLQDTVFKVAIFTGMFTFSMGCTLIVFSICHLLQVSKNLTTNESIREIYQDTPNPFNKGCSENMHLFWSVYPKSPSNLVDKGENSNEYYSKILQRYGEVHARATQDQQSTRQQVDLEDFRNYRYGPIRLYED